MSVSGTNNAAIKSGNLSLFIAIDLIIRVYFFNHKDELNKLNRFSHLLYHTAIHLDQLP